MTVMWDGNLAKVRRLVDGGMAREALALFESFADSATGGCEAMLLAARCALGAGDARALHRHALAAAASAASPRQCLAAASYLQRAGESGACQALLRSARFTVHADATSLAQACAALTAMGRGSDAEPLLMDGIARYPMHAGLLHILGNLRLFQGRPVEAEALYERSLAADPALFQNAWMLASVRTHTSDENHVERLQRQRSLASHTGLGLAYVCFALHKELHDLRRYDEAWSALAEGCQVKRSTFRYDVADDLARAKLACALTRDDVIGTNHSAGLGMEATPTFIVGMHRSGTTLLEQRLGRHPDVHRAGETHAVERAIEQATGHLLPDNPDPGAYALALKADRNELAAGLARHAAWYSAGKPFYIDKLPQNFWWIPSILQALPRSRIVHVERDPLDTCFSNLRSLFGSAAPYSYRMDELATFFALQRRVVSHFSALAPERVLQVRYLDLVHDTEREIARIARFCGLPSPRNDDGDSIVVTASHSEARKAIDPDRGGAWRPYYDRLSPLVEALG